MEIRGWIRTSLIEYPDHIATVLFTGGCQFRCPMCHNADLVLCPHDVPVVSEDEVWDFLARREGLVDGVAITGGEPTLQADLLPFLRRLRDAALDVKLDTNGYRPDLLATLLDDGLVSYVAMDVKAPPAKYPQLAGVPDLDVSRIEQSVDLLLTRHVGEFRTTVVPGLLDGDDVEAIARWVSGAARYALQQFRPLGTLDPALTQATPYPVDVLRAMAARAAPYVQQVIVRGV